MRHDQRVWRALGFLWGARDKRRKHGWYWAMPRDMWTMLRECSDENLEPLIRPSVEHAVGTLLGQPIIIDNDATRLELRKAEGA